MMIFIHKKLSIKHWHFIPLGSAAVATAIAWSLHGVNLGKVATSLAAIRFPFLAAVLIFTTFNLFIRVVVWRTIVNPMRTLALREAFTTYLLGVFSNIFLPLKLGDMVQGYSLSRKGGINPVSAVSAVMAQRIAEAATLLLLMGAISVVFSFPALFRRHSLILASAVAACSAALFGLHILRRPIDTIAGTYLARIAPRTAEAVRNFPKRVLEGTGALRDLPNGLGILGLSLSSWALQIAMVAITARALDIRLDPIAASAVLLIINLGLGIPIAPGNIGTFQFFAILPLSFFSIGKTEALTFSIAFQAIQGVPIIIGGLGALALSGRTQRDAKPASCTTREGTSAFVGRDGLA